MTDGAKPWSPTAALLLLCSSFLAAGCRSSPEVREIEVSVSRVAVDEMSRSPVVLLENKERTVSLPIWIGLSEAQAIAVEMEGVAPPRPMTHDLLKQVLDRLGVELRRVLISELRGNTYYARIYLVSRGAEHEIDSRPSDAIALAVRFRKPIFVTAELMQRQREAVVAAEGGATTSVAGVTVQGISPALAEHFAVPEGQGVLVADVARGAKHELRRGDVILEIDGEPVHGVRDFHERVAALDGEADFSVKRGEVLLHLAFDPSVIDPER